MRLDLNLLPILEVLVQEKSVSRAAARLHITQPAVSYALAKLRHQFNDPLLVKTRGGMNPTPRALQLMGPIRAALDELTRALTIQPAFVPARAAGEVHVGISEYAGYVILPALLKRLAAEAPELRFSVRHVGHEAADIADAAHGCDLTLALGSKVPAPFRAEEVMRDEAVLIAHETKMKLGASVSLKRYFTLPRVMQSPWSPELRAILDAVERRMEVVRPRVLSIPHTLFPIVPTLFDDFVTTHPRRMAMLYAKGPRYRILKMPVAYPPLVIQMVWHRKHEDSELHAWLRKVTREVCAGIVAADGKPRRRGRER